MRTNNSHQFARKDVADCSARCICLVVFHRLLCVVPAIKMTLELNTEDKLEYQFHPITFGVLNFKVRAANDAHLCLSSEPNESGCVYEIFIGGWGNSKTAIRRNRQKPDKALAETPNILNGGEYRGFWVRWSSGSIAIGKEGEAAPFVAWDDPEPFPVAYFGVCTGWGATGSWLIENAPSAPLGWNLDLSGGGGGGAASWVDASGGHIPPNAVPGGHDGEQLYVGRASHEGELVPGKIVPSHGVCYIAWGGGEHGKPDYQVLVGCSPVWAPAIGGQVPPDALPAGQTDSGEPLFVGRASHEGSMTLGKVHPSHNVCYIPYGGQEIAYQEYEVLVAK